MINDHETGPSVQIKSTKQMRVIKATEELDRYAIFLASFATRVRRTFFTGAHLLRVRVALEAPARLRPRVETTCNNQLIDELDSVASH